MLLYVNGLPLVFIELKNSDVKLRAAKKFLENEDKVKFTLRLRGREMAHIDLALQRGAEHAHQDQRTQERGLDHPRAKQIGQCCGLGRVQHHAFGPHAHQQGITLKQAAVALAHVTADEFDAWVQPQSMTAPREQIK